MNDNPYRRLLALVPAALFFVLLVVLHQSGVIRPEAMTDLLQRNRENAFYLLLLLHIVSPSLFLPTFYLTIAAGLIYGPVWGVLLDVSGSTIGSILAFLLSRGLPGRWLRGLIKNERFHALLNSSRVDWKLNAFMRLNPVFPSSLIGYFFGMTNIPLTQFAWSTFAFLLPASAVIVLAGDSIREWLAGGDFTTWLLKLSILVLMTAGWIFLGYASRRFRKEDRPE